MSGRKSRLKGKRGELEAAAMLRQLTGLDVKRIYGQARQGDDAPDIDGPGLEWCVEVKNQRAIKLRAWWDQACEVAAKDGRPPMLMIKLPGGRWLKVTGLG